MPRPLPFVVKNGSKMRARVAASMPTPVSVTASITYWPGGTSRGPTPWAEANSTLAVSMVIRPPRGIASRALITRLKTTWSTCGRSAITCWRSEARCVSMATSSPMMRVSIATPASTTSLRSSTCGSTIDLRLKTISCRVRSAARSPALWISSTSPRIGLSAGSFINASSL